MAPIIARRADAACHLDEQFLAAETGSSQQAERYQVPVSFPLPIEGRARHAHVHFPDLTAAAKC